MTIKLFASFTWNSFVSAKCSHLITNRSNRDYCKFTLYAITIKKKQQRVKID